MTRDGKRYLMQYYRPPSPPECAKERRFTVEKMIGDDETTIYTPWGTSSNQEIVYMTTLYHCLPVLGKKDNHPLSCNEMISKGNMLTFRISAWSYKKNNYITFGLEFGIGNHNQEPGELLMKMVLPRIQVRCKQGIFLNLLTI